MKRFHVHVGVTDIDKSVAFYSSLFGAEPSVVKADYAKWMLDDPRINFAISMREEAVKRENKANLDKARNQLEVARQLAEVGKVLESSPIAHELLRLQMLSDMGEGGKVVVIDAKSGAQLAGLAG